MFSIELCRCVDAIQNEFLIQLSNACTARVLPCRTHQARERQTIKQKNRVMFINGPTFVMCVSIESNSPDVNTYYIKRKNMFTLLFALNFFAAHYKPKRKHMCISSCINTCNYRNINNNLPYYSLVYSALLRPITKNKKIRK